MGHGRDNFFRSRPCDRCGSEEALTIHTMSWFTEQRICMKCSEDEDEIKKKLYEKEPHAPSWEGCGYIPEV